MITINTSDLDPAKQGLVSLPKQFFDKYKLFQAAQGCNGEQNASQIDFLITDSFWDFDNIGVSRSIESLNLDEGHSPANEAMIPFANKKYRVVNASKYLICSECDRGPVGVVLSLQEDDSEAQRDVCLLSLASVNME